MPNADIIETRLDATLLNPYVNALTNASGITECQARICVLYALCTYRADLTAMPVLAVIGSTGTGKSGLLSQMIQLVNKPIRASATSTPSMRDEMSGCSTYIIDEADHVSERLIQWRSCKDNAEMMYKVSTRDGWENRTVNIYGATILARRSPFKDSALRNRAIVIATQNKPGDYAINAFMPLEGIFKQLSIVKISSSGRVANTWNPLIEIARAIDEQSWVQAVGLMMDAEKNIFKSGQEYDPREIVLQSLDSLTWSRDSNSRITSDIQLSDLTERTCKIGDVKFMNKQIEEICLTLGFNVTYTHGTKYVRLNSSVLEKLLERS